MSQCGSGVFRIRLTGDQEVYGMKVPSGIKQQTPRGVQKLFCKFCKLIHKCWCSTKQKCDTMLFAMHCIVQYDSL